MSFRDWLVLIAEAGQPAPERQRYFVIERAGVRFLVGDANLGQQLKNHVRFDFELACQLINTDFAHTIWSRCPLTTPGFSDNYPCSFSRVTASAANS
jgi:hypothetical protein